MESSRIHLFISGLVQGVFFRAHTQEIAQRLGLVGWVRNLDDGRVEVIAEGREIELQKLIDWCWQGPPGARVDDVEIIYEEPTNEYRGFEIKYSRW
jgi:acylphosphatase|uniref:Acylphosphatase n=1 Tax=candidate division WOR-3 bacterium TaxID=2052148 RepID=A0A7C6AFS6_UNCW3